MRRLRYLSLGFSLFVLLLAMGMVTPAGAASLPPSGTISCVVAGDGAIKPPLSNTPSTKKLSISGTASGSSCDNSGVTGGKATITAAKVKFQLKEPDTGYTCTNYDLGFDTSKLQVTWQSVDAKGHAHTVGTETEPIQTFEVTSTNPITYRIVSAPKVKKGPFQGSTMTFITVLDTDLATLLAACDGGGVGPFSFGHVQASTISVP